MLFCSTKPSYLTKINAWPWGVKHLDYITGNLSAKCQLKPLMAVIAVVLLLIQGCGTLVRHDAVPQQLTHKAEIPGLPGVRYRMGNPEDLAAMSREGVESVERERAYLTKIGHSGDLPPATFLAVSGGVTMVHLALAC